MRAPESLLALLDEGIIDEVVRPLMSGKEAQVYLVRSEGEARVAKVYKEAHMRSFKQRAEYTEGRNARNSRDQRAMTKRTRHGREQDEAAWRSAEVDMIYRLRAAGVRVPTPYHFVDGVLIMELVAGTDGHPAPRLGDLDLDRQSATEVFDRVLAEVIRMLAAGVVHGDLSDFNVLMGTDGPVIIDFPQAVDAASNQNARKLLLRDVDNLHRFIGKYVPGRQPPPFAQEMWELYERGELTPDTTLNGRYQAPQKQAGTADVLDLIADAEHDERRRREALGIRMRGGSSTTPDATRARSRNGTPMGPIVELNPRTRVQSQAPAGPQLNPRNHERRHVQPNPRAQLQRNAPAQPNPRGQVQRNAHPQGHTANHPSSIGQASRAPQPPRRHDAHGAQRRPPPQPGNAQTGATQTDAPTAPKPRRRRHRVARSKHLISR